jgi:hypothetical protein
MKLGHHFLMIDGGIADLGQQGSGGQREQQGERGQGRSSHMGHHCREPVYFKPHGFTRSSIDYLSRRIQRIPMPLAERKL